MALGRTFLPGSLEKPDNFVPLASTGFSSQGRSMLRAFGKTRNLELENPVHRIWLQFARSNWWGIHGFDWGLDLDLKSFLLTGFEGKIWILFKSNILDWIFSNLWPFLTCFASYRTWPWPFGTQKPNGGKFTILTFLGLWQLQKASYYKSWNVISKFTSLQPEVISVGGLIL